MKKLIMLGAAGLLVAGAVAIWAAQDTTIERNEVRDPVRLQAWLQDNASDAQTRIAALESADVVLGTNAVAATRLMGNIALARVTNALTSAGSAIGGNIPLAALTNALSPTLYSGTVTNNPATTNVYVILNGVVVSVTQL